MTNKNILIIGMSKAGKTHFGGQLYGRLKSGEDEFKLRETPNDLSLFQEILDNLNEGLEGKHTDTKLHETIILPVISRTGNEIDLIYPDYGGEQLRGIIEQRRANAIWQQQIAKSTNWFLFIRLDLIEDIIDVTTKFYQQIEAEKDIKEPISNITDLLIESSAYYIELLQSFLFIKGMPLTAADKPRLTILLSCWDKLKYPEGTEPTAILRQRMPLFYSFIDAGWNNNNLSVIGLSSLSKDLDSKKVDAEFALEGPEKFGYVVKEDGGRETDITYLLNQVFI
jgi:hypothetical protein